MTGVLDAVFSAPVTITPVQGAAYDVSATFRKEPVDVAGDEGEPVLISAPTLRVRRDLASGLARGDEVRPSIAPGEVYRVVNHISDGSPAGDGYLLVALEQMS